MSNYYRGKKVVAVVPAFNEEETISDVVNSLLSKVTQVIVVDDCSRDKTGVLAKKAGAVVLNNETNLGYDRSLNRGFEEAFKSGAHVVFTFDADGQHDISDLDLMVNPILDGEADMVIGQRQERSSFGEWLFSVYSTYRFGVKDPLCGFKVYRRDVYDSLGCFDTLNSIGTQLLLESIKKGYTFKAVDIRINSRADTSRFYISKIKGNIRIIKALLKIVWNLEVITKK